MSKDDKADDEQGFSEEDLERIEADYRRAVDPDEKCDLALALGDILLGSEADEALDWYERALEAMPNDPEALAGCAEAMFELWRFEEADKTAARAIRRDQRAARAHYVLAMLAERRGQKPEADRSYEKAAEHDPERFFRPARLSQPDFQTAVTEALGHVPEAVKKLLRDVTVVVEELPAADRQQGYLEEGLAPTVLGLFEGTPPGARGHDAAPELPPRITLYQRNIERVSPDRETLLHEIARTVLHEVGHLVGMDEEDLEDAGYE